MLVNQIFLVWLPVDCWRQTDPNEAADWVRDLDGRNGLALLRIGSSLTQFFTVHGLAMFCRVHSSGTWLKKNNIFSAWGYARRICQFPAEIAAKQADMGTHRRCAVAWSDFDTSTSRQFAELFAATMLPNTSRPQTVQVGGSWNRYEDDNEPYWAVYEHDTWHSAVHASFCLWRKQKLLSIRPFGSFSDCFRIIFGLFSERFWFVLELDHFQTVLYRFGSVFSFGVVIIVIVVVVVVVIVIVVDVPSPPSCPAVEQNCYQLSLFPDGGLSSYLLVAMEV